RAQVTRTRATARRSPACGDTAAAPPSTRPPRDWKLLPLLEDVEPLLLRLRQAHPPLSRIAAGPVAVLGRHAVRIAVLRQDVLRLEFVDQDDRRVDGAVLLGGGGEKTIAG